MKSLLFSFFFVLFVASSPAQNDRKTQNIEVLPESSISVHGDVKITDFTCGFDIDQLQVPSAIPYEVGQSKITFSNAELVLQSRGFDCGSKSRNEDFRSMVEAEEYPEMKLQLREVKLKEGKNATAVATIFIAGKENSYSIPITIDKRSNSVSQYKGIFNVNIRDFGLEPIKKMFGLIQVQDIIQINLDLYVKH